MKYIDKLVSISSAERSARFKVAATLGGAAFFLVAVAWFAMWVSNMVVGFISRFIMEPLPITGTVIIALGLCIILWVILTMWFRAKGTPVPAAATEKLIVSGPFKYCRNPLQLGFILYLLGVGTALFSLATGIVALFLGFVVGYAYHRYVEEKELYVRFGSEYDEYRRSTPFIIPGFFRR